MVSLPDFMISSFASLIGKFRKWASNRIGKMRLRNMLLIVFILILVLPITIVTNTTLAYSKLIIQNEASVLVSNTISQVSTSIDEMFQGNVVNVANFLLHDERIHEILTRNYYSSDTRIDRLIMLDELTLSNKILLQYTATYDNIKIAVLYGKNGQVYNISFPRQEERILKQELEKISDDIMENGRMIEFLNLQQNIFNAQSSANPRERNVVLVVSRVFDYSTTQYKGLCVFTIFERAIYEKYMNNRIGRTGQIFIIDDKGNLISHMDENILSTRNVNPVWVRNALENANKSFIFKENGKTFLGFTHISSVTGWITAGIVPLDELLEQTGKVTFSAYTIMVIAILITLAAAIMISVTITRPINRVIGSMKEFQDGNFNTKIDISGGYEVSKLAEYFNVMVDKIRELITKEYELEKRKKKAELYVLQSQINPHFLYNTLESIIWKAKILRADEICYMASALGKLFRLAVNKGAAFVKVKEEIEYVKAYMEIQNIRYGGKISLSIHLDEDTILEYKTLKLILQPVVENAIYHGLEAMKEQGSICINIHIENSNLVFDITDNGVGMTQEVLDCLNSRLKTDISDKSHEKRGIGLVNIHQRIELYFGKGYGIQVRSRDQKGTTVTIVVPVIREGFMV